MTQFFETLMGKRFFEGTVPKLARAVERLADRLTEEREYEQTISLVQFKTEKDGLHVSLARPPGKGWRIVGIATDEDRVYTTWERPKPQERRST